MGYLDTWTQQIEAGKNYNQKLGKDMMAKLMSSQNLSEEYMDSVQIAFDEFIENAVSFKSAEDMVEIWSEIYAPNFTGDELDLLIAFYTSPIGKKEVKVSQETSAKFTSKLQEEGRGAMEKATNKYISDLQSIIKSCACPK